MWDSGYGREEGRGERGMQVAGGGQSGRRKKSD